MRIGLITLVIIAGVLLSSGAIHRMLVNRYNQQSTALDLLESQLPKEVGDWKTTSTRGLQANAKRQLQCLDSSCRVYTNQKTGEVVDVMFLYGPKGPLTVHTPDVCYTAKAFSLENSGDRISFDAEPNHDEFYTVTLRSRGVDAERMVVAYGWNSGNGWRAPRFPRGAFVRQKYVYKLQVAGLRSSPTTKEDGSHTIRDFLERFLPAVEHLTRSHSPS